MTTTSSNAPADYAGKVGFCIGTGRCGTTFLAEVCNRESAVAASHERRRLAATFHMFCKWHGLAVDPEGFLAGKERDIRKDLIDHTFSLESSALLSHSLAELHDRFQAKFVLLIRHPAETVASFAARGWFLNTPVRSDSTLPPTYFAGEKARHFLGRNIPSGEEFARWSKLSQIGKIAWFWQARNRAILEQFARLPQQACTILRLEDFDFAAYQQLAAFFGWEPQATGEPQVTGETFQELADAKLNAGPNPPRKCSTWSAEEFSEFESEVAEIASAVGYTYLQDDVTGSDAQDLCRPLGTLPEVLAQVKTIGKLRLKL